MLLLNNILKVRLPRFKSNVIRYQMANYVFFSTIIPICNEDAHDVKIVHRALQNIEQNKDNNNTTTIINIEDCGTAYRFLLPILAATPGEWLLTGTKRLLQRPIMPLVALLRENGAEITPSENGWHIAGRKIKMENPTILCQQSSQFASALLLAQPLLGFNSEDVTNDGNFPSLAYIELTKKIISDVKDRKETFLHERDWSAAAYWYGYALLKKNQAILLEELSFQSIQNDKKLADFFEKLGVHSEESEKGILVSYQKREESLPSSIDLSNHIDLAPVIAATATLFPFELTIIGVENLKYKESNRWQHLIETVSRFTRVEILSSSSFKIYKREKELPNHITFNSMNDHRLVMAWHLFALFTMIEIENQEAVKKSYPTFFHTI